MKIQMKFEYGCCPIIIQLYYSTVLVCRWNLHRTRTWKEEEEEEQQMDFCLCCLVFL